MLMYQQQQIEKHKLKISKRNEDPTKEHKFWNTQVTTLLDRSLFEYKTDYTENFVASA